ncbi:MAG TPA: TSUP family transporter [Bryobacteraceae bacterium]|nr:TSUP family transporter [Bryobacteraceae bacterium]
MTPFLIAIAAVAAATGGIASVSAVGIGSILTPLVALKYDIRTAIAVVAIPHAAAMLLRLVRLRREIDYPVLFGFGLMNVAGAFAGALLQAAANTHLLALLLGGLLVMVGVAGAAGWADRLRLSRASAWGAGALSGGFGGLVGSQGPMRSAAMLGLDIRKEAFVATATAIGLAVDAVRLPVYFATQGQHMLAAWPVVVTATAAVLVGTLLGEYALRRIPERRFRRLVCVIIAAVGAVLFVRFV